MFAVIYQTGVSHRNVKHLKIIFKNPFMGSIANSKWQKKESVNGKVDE
jgi:hypothetical protein